MNVVQLHNRIQFWLDTVNSPRFPNDQVDHALNISISQIFEDKYKNAKGTDNDDEAFQLDYKVRAELRLFIKELDIIPINNIFTNISFPENYRYTTLMTGVIGPTYNYTITFNVGDKLMSIADGTTYNGIVYDWGSDITIITGHLTLTQNDLIPSGGLVVKYSDCFIKYDFLPLSHDEKTSVFQNPFKRPTLKYPTRLYFTEVTNGYELICPQGYSVNNLHMFYLANPTYVNYGTSYNQTKVFTVGNVLYCSQNGTIYNGQIYNSGDEITIIIDYLQITSGQVQFGYADTEFLESVHNEITFKAACYLLSISAQGEKIPILFQQFYKK